MTEPTPRTVLHHTKALGKASYALEQLAETLDRQTALLRRWVEREKAKGGILQIAVLEDTERELGAK